MTSGGLAWWPGGRPPGSVPVSLASPRAEAALTPEGTAHSSPGARGPGRDEAVALALGGLKPDRWQERPRASPKPGSQAVLQ